MTITAQPLPARQVVSNRNVEVCRGRASSSCVRGHKVSTPWARGDGARSPNSATVTPPAAAAVWLGLAKARHLEQYRFFCKLIIHRCSKTAGIFGRREYVCDGD